MSWSQRRSFADFNLNLQDEVKKGVSTRTLMETKVQNSLHHGIKFTWVANKNGRKNKLGKMVGKFWKT